MSDYKQETYLVKDSLIIIEPAYKLTGFVLDSGSIYKAEVCKDFENVYRLPIKVFRFNNELTLVASKVLVTDSSKYYYEAGYVYVYNPSSDFIVMLFQLFYGSRGFKLPRNLTSGADVYFEPRVIGNPNFQRTQKDKFQGVSVTGEASFSLINTNEDIFQPLENMLYNDLYSFITKNVRIYRMLTETDYKPKQLMFSGTIESWSMDRRQVNFTCKDYVKKLDDSVQTIEYNLTDYPNCDPYFLGKVVRTIYGKVIVKTVNIDYVDGGDQTQNRVWKISHHANKSVSSVSINGVALTLTTHYTLNADKNQITLVDNMETALSIDTINASDFVQCTVEGKLDGVNLIENASDIVKDVLYSVGFTSNDLNLTSFATAKTANTYKIGIALPQNIDDERPTALDVISQINTSVFGFLVTDSDFKIKYSIYSDGVATAVLDKDLDIIGRDRTVETTDLASIYTVKYLYNETIIDFDRTKTKTNDTAKYLHNITKTSTIESVLWQDADAQSLVETYASFFSKPYATEDFKIKLQLDDKICGDFIEIDGNTYEIIKLDKSIKDTSVTVRGI